MTWHNWALIAEAKKISWIPITKALLFVSDELYYTEMLHENQ